ncbi:DUF72 domain-containing protein [Piscinibacterium candidicorallinum]|uniref:DUF72 domain-containing protein n=1 Tax=Piscinibacterium candidicorallinum TaxID=1793872 RepID=A0ABV7H5D6_9BURK
MSGPPPDQFGLFGEESGAPSKPPAGRQASRKAREAEPAGPLPDALQLPRPLPPGVHLGTSSWSFPGWAGLVYPEAATESTLARKGLKQYARHPVLGGVGIDRGFYAPLSETQYRDYAQQVPPHFRFLIKAPSTVCDAMIRGERGVALQPNADFLNARLAVEQFVKPCLDGLEAKAGALVFQLSPVHRALLADPAGFAARIGEFFGAIRAAEPRPATLALELRDPELLTPRLVRTLGEHGVRLCIGIHARMPELARQARALELLPPGPLVVRWSLHAGMKYEGARDRYAPFNRLVDPDLDTRHGLADLAAAHVRMGQPVQVIINNKAEGSAPLSVLELARAIIDRLADTPLPPATPESP